MIVVVGLTLVVLAVICLQRGQDGILFIVNYVGGGGRGGAQPGPGVAAAGLQPPR